nr:translation initiation factor IF-2 [Treponema endosymbiont of Eucomonympha sp.]
MANETESKQPFILNKKKPEAPVLPRFAPEAMHFENTEHTAVDRTGWWGSPSQEKGTVQSIPPGKKKLIVRKKRLDSSAITPVPQGQKLTKRSSVEIKRSLPPAQVATTAPSVQAAHTPSTFQIPYILMEQNAPVPEATANKENSSAVPVKKIKTTFALNPVRPNIKAGNLSERARQSRSPYGRNLEQSPRNNSRDIFTGAQAREGYQNRFNDRNGGAGSAIPLQQSDWQQSPPFQSDGFRNNGYRNKFQRQGGGIGYGTGIGRPPIFGTRTGFAPPSQNANAARKNLPKKSSKSRKAIYSKKDREDFRAGKLFLQKKKEALKANAVPEQIEIMDMISVSGLARKMNLKASDLIGKLMSMGMMVTINQSVDADTATLLAAEYNCIVRVVSLYDETIIGSDAASGSGTRFRPPVVTIMGHVDHGKTKTLDAIRQTHVAESEAGGITQRIGAYMVETEKGKITFLDTPGHEAFTMMRSRGAEITDIVVLVIAADDGVMPQTVEAVNHAKAANVPIVVAINKIDKLEANPDRIKTQLSELGLTPEEWGGETQYVHISALRKKGVDDLLDAILLQAEVLELGAVWDCRAEGKILDSKIDHGRGIVSTVLIEQGTLRVGDAFVAGVYSGRIRAIFNDHGEKITEATPSMPVEIIGMDFAPNAGDPFSVTDSEKTARAISLKRQELRRFEDAKSVNKITLENLYTTIDAGNVSELKVIIKADEQGSAEALKQSLEKLSTRDIRLAVILSSAGAINESDVMLAASGTNTIVVGFNVRPSPKAKELADQSGVDIRKYNIIYKAVEEITQAMEGMLQPEEKEEVIGMAEVREVFKIPKVGVIAGSYMTQGFIKQSASVHILRDNIVIYTGKVSSLRRFKDDAREVATGYECGIGVDSWQDIQAGDQFEVFEYIKVARKLSDSKAASGTTAVREITANS